MNPCRLHPEADAEYAAAAEYYASVRSGLGGRFYDEIERLIAAIRTDPLPGREIQPSIRWRLSSIFPYAVIQSAPPRRHPHPGDRASASRTCLLAPSPQLIRRPPPAASPIKPGGSGGSGA